jgi:hypothetical protein
LSDIKISILNFTCWLLSVATLFQSIELLQLKKVWTNTGIWSWSILRQDRSSFPNSILPFLDTCFSARSFTAILWLRTLSSLGFIIGFGYFESLVKIHIGILLITTWLIAVRWRGTFNGGSDSMTAHIALYVWIAQCFSSSSWLVRTCLGCIAIQVTLSYFIAGIAKLRNPEWRSGECLPKLFQISGYPEPPDSFKKIIQHPKYAFFLSWMVILFECLFPFSWIDSRLCLVFIGLAIGFHGMNFRIFGLNRFIFAWLAGYPSLYYFSMSHSLQ